MSALHWTRGWGLTWGAPGALWSWAATRLDWTARFNPDNEETLILTQSDELSRAYGEDSRPPSNSVTYNSNYDDSKRQRTSSGDVTPHCATSQDRAETRGVGGHNKHAYKTAADAQRACPHDAGERVVSPVKVRPMQVRCSERQVAVRTTLSQSPTITAWEAGWNVTNAIQGIFVLDLPFALVHSGYVGLVLLVMSAWVCNYTGRVLVSCLYEDGHCGGPRVRVRQSYQDIAEACCRGLCPRCPALGGAMVNVAQLIELLMTCTLYLVVSTSLLCDSLSGLAVPRLGCSLLGLMFLMPCLLLTDLRPVSTLSLLCSLAHIVISLLVMLYCLTRARSWVWPSLSLSVDPEEFLVSVGVIIFSYTSQIFLPSLEGSMEDRRQFNTMMGWTHGVACVIKTLFALLCVLTWGRDTSEVITDSLTPVLRPLVNTCLLAKALLSFPLPFYSAAEILQTWVLKDGPSHPKPDCPLPRPVLLLRAALLLACLLLALLLPRFSLLMGLTGSVTGAAMTLVLPCVFHLRLQWDGLSARDRLTDGCILGLGVLCSASGVFCSVKRLLQGL